MNITYKVLLCLLILAALTCFSRAEDFGISQKTFDAEHLHAVFTFRHGVLIHEITQFLDPATKKRETWVERFYAESREVFVRAGAAQLSSAYYTGSSPVSMGQGSRRLYVGHEAFNLGEDGCYHVIADPESILRESVISDPVFSTQALDQERQKHLTPTQTKLHE